MGRILSIDYGEKRTGVAWTDALQISINPLTTIDTSKFESEIKKLLDTTKVSEVVYGLPCHKDGVLTKVGKKVVEIINKQKGEYPHILFHTIDESFTSQRARQMMLHLGAKKKKREQKSNIDQMSAVIILKDFIDRQ